MSLETAVVLLLLAARPEVLFSFQDAEIGESSAIVDGGDVVFTINDSGDSARVFVVDKRNGQTVGITTYGDEDPVDVEALAAGPGDTLWVGDIGDNDAERSHITVYGIPTPGRGDATVEPTSYEMVYDDGPRDAETLLVHPKTGRMYVVSKGLLGGTVYAAPKQLREDRTNVLQPVGGAGGLVTDGVFLPDGEHLLLRDYVSATLVAASDFTPLARFRLPAQEQGEGIGYDGQRVLVSTEGEYAEVRALALPPRVLEAMEPTPSATPTPEPGGEVAAADDEAPWAKVLPWALVAGWIVVAAVGARWVLRRRR
ncbi:MAG TPA: hypothetical protein VLI04_06440 [Nocardioidaceae bacterium]|nr:hypothetical protein [Nocardioidaceae bacterium]